MDDAHSRARFDWLVEFAGALAPGLASGFAAFKLAPSLAVAPPPAMTASAFGGFGLGLLAMRLVRPAPRRLALPDFEVAAIEEDEEPLLLENRYEEPLLLTEVVEDEALLLDDPLIVAQPDLRVVQLFATQPVPTPGQLKERIDRHLAGGSHTRPESPVLPGQDAAGALYAALDDLRRSLR